MRAILLALLGFLTLFPALARAETSIAVVDVLRIMNVSKAAQSIQTQRETRREEFLAEISKSEQELQGLEKTLLAKRSTLTAEDYAKERKHYEEKLLNVRKLTQSRKKSLEEASGQAMNELRDHLYTIVQSIADERGYTLVISNQNVITGAKSLDITEETLKRLDRELPAVPMDIKD